MAQQEISPVTGILAEENVFIDFGEHEGKSVLEISDTTPNFYEFLKEQKDDGNFAIRRTKEKTYRLYINENTIN